jgi:hypothetical protein
VTEPTLRDWLHTLAEQPEEEVWTALAFLAGQRVELDPAVRNAAIRRAELLLATGGDPHRRLELSGRPVTAIAADLDQPDAREQLADGLRALERETAGVRGAEEARRRLLDEPELAWQCYAAALLAAELAEADSSESGA